MSDLVQQRKNIIESWNITWNINKTGKSGPMGFRYIYPFIALITIPALGLTNYAILNEFLNFSQRFVWSDMTFFTSISVSLLINATHRYHLASYLYKHYFELDSNAFTLSEEANEKLKEIIKANHKPLLLTTNAIGIILVITGFVSHLGDFPLMWRYALPFFIVFEILFLVSGYRYLKLFKDMKATLHQ